MLYALGSIIPISAVPIYLQPVLVPHDFQETATQAIIPQNRPYLYDGRDCFGL